MHVRVGIAEAARELGRSYETVRRWAKAGKIVAYQPAGDGGSWVIDLTASFPQMYPQKKSEPPALARKTAQIS